MMNRKDSLACFRLHLEPMYHEPNERSIGNPFQNRVARPRQGVLEMVGADANRVPDPPGLLRHKLISKNYCRTPCLTGD
jgi:hypothetical protein